jgi:hypothetical protein
MAGIHGIGVVHAHERPVLEYERVGFSADDGAKIAILVRLIVPHKRTSVPE